MAGHQRLLLLVMSVVLIVDLCNEGYFNLLMLMDLFDCFPQHCCFLSFLS